MMAVGEHGRWCANSDRSSLSHPLRLWVSVPVTPGPRSGDITMPMPRNGHRPLEPACGAMWPVARWTMKEKINGLEHAADNCNQ